MFIQNQWYVAAFSSDLGDGLLARTICGEPVVFFRDREGVPVGLEDRCPHRRLPLSLGRLIGGEIECAYHGLRLTPSGHCTFAPGLSRKMPGAIARTHVVEERDGFLWMWIGEKAKADRGLIPDYSWHRRDGWEWDDFHVRIEGEYRLGVDNLLDLSHATYVHATNVGNAAVSTIDPEVVVGVDSVEVKRSMRDVENSRTMGELTGLPRSDNLRATIFRPPADIRIETIYLRDAPGEAPVRREIQVVTPLTPETGRSHHQFLAHCRNFVVPPERRKAFVADIEKVLAEDKFVIEAQQRAIETDRPDATMMNLKIDRGPNAARAMLARLEAGTVI